jgi:5-methyltetrahydropteroyltriglutamate--homocysteine methyltransferase
VSAGLKPWRAEVVGSLLRPADLVVARKRLDSGEMTSAEFKAVEDEAVRSAIELQAEAGIDVVTDGELRRYAFYGHLIDSFEGFDREGGWAIPFRDERGEQLILKRPVVVSPLRWKRSMCGEEWTFLRSAAGRPGKVTMLSAQ